MDWKSLKGIEEILKQTINDDATEKHKEIEEPINKNVKNTDKAQTHMINVQEIKEVMVN